VSDQQANRFQVFTREGTAGDPHLHQRVAIIPVSTNESDGSDVTNVRFGDLFPKGFFVAMSDNKTFQIYNWSKLEEQILLQKN
jgi:myo-inositol-hexaphosphate 3-phosphohydrolase